MEGPLVGSSAQLAASRGATPHGLVGYTVLQQVSTRHAYYCGDTSIWQAVNHVYMSAPRCTSCVSRLYYYKSRQLQLPKAKCKYGGDLAAWDCICLLLVSRLYTSNLRHLKVIQISVSVHLTPKWKAAVDRVKNVYQSQDQHSLDSSCIARIPRCISQAAWPTLIVGFLQAHSDVVHAAYSSQRGDHVPYAIRK